MEESKATVGSTRKPYNVPWLRLVPVVGVCTQLTVVSGNTPMFGDAANGDWGEEWYEGGINSFDFGGESLLGSWDENGISGYTYSSVPGTNSFIDVSDLGSWRGSDDSGSTRAFEDTVGGSW